MTKRAANGSNKDVTDWLKLGIDISGNTIATMIGAQFAGTPGALIGASITPLITETLGKIGGDFKNRIFSKCEEVRVGATFTYVISKIKERLDAGEVPRDNDFFNHGDGRRPASEEILEAALRLAQKEHEELKIKHYGYLIANIYFDNRIDRAYANLLISIADRLSYRKLLLLELFNNTSKFKLNDENKSSIEEKNRPSKVIGGVDLSLYSSSKLDLRGLLLRRQADLNTEINELDTYQLIDKKFNVPSHLGESFAHIGLTEIGSQLRRLMELKEINHKELEDIAGAIL